VVGDDTTKMRLDEEVLGLKPQYFRGCVVTLGGAGVRRSDFEICLEDGSEDEATREGRDRSKIVCMAGSLPNTKRFRHGRPDRGRCF
jgi:hypothetical protein